MSSGSVIPPGRLTAMPSAIVRAVWASIGLPASIDAGNGAQAAAWTPTISTSRPSGLDRQRDARAQAAAADRDDDLGQVRHVLEQFEAERALPGDDRRVVERVHERQAAGLGALERGDQALVDAVAADVDRGAGAAGGLDLGHRRVGGDEDLAGDAPSAPPPRPAPGRGCRRDAATTPLLHPSPSAASLAATPRTLKEPVRCRFSALSTTVPPARSLNVRVDRIGVRRATFSTAARAAVTSLAVTLIAR